MNKRCGGKNKGGKGGFTLLELLIVVSIIAILSVALVFILNPAETLKKSRDVQRIADLNTLKTTLGLYLTSTSTADLKLAGSGTVCTTARDSATTTAQDVTGTGWINVNLTTLSGGSPISNLPVDPTNTGGYWYIYRCSANGDKFEISAKLESDAYGATGENRAGKDGGNDSTRYEVGTDLTTI